MIFFMILISCTNRSKENRLPNPPPIEPKYIVNYKGVDYPFNSEIERKKFLDSVGISIDTSKVLQ